MASYAPLTILTLIIGGGFVVFILYNLDNIKAFITQQINKDDAEDDANIAIVEVNRDIEKKGNDEEEQSHTNLQKTGNDAQAAVDTSLGGQKKQSNERLNELDINPGDSGGQISNDGANGDNLDKKNAVGGAPTQNSGVVAELNTPVTSVEISGQTQQAGTVSQTNIAGSPATNNEKAPQVKNKADGKNGGDDSSSIEVIEESDEDSSTNPLVAEENRKRVGLVKDKINFIASTFSASKSKYKDFADNILGMFKYFTSSKRHFAYGVDSFFDLEKNTDRNGNSVISTEKLAAANIPLENSWFNLLKYYARTQNVSFTEKDVNNGIAHLKTITSSEKFTEDKQNLLFNTIAAFVTKMKTKYFAGKSKDGKTYSYNLLVNPFEFKEKHGYGKYNDACLKNLYMQEFFSKLHESAKELNDLYDDFKKFDDSIITNICVHLYNGMTRIIALQHLYAYEVRYPCYNRPALYLEISKPRTSTKDENFILQAFTGDNTNLKAYKTTVLYQKYHGNKNDSVCVSYEDVNKIVYNVELLFTTNERLRIIEQEKHATSAIVPIGTSTIRSTSPVQTASASDPMTRSTDSTSSEYFKVPNSTTNPNSPTGSNFNSIHVINEGPSMSASGEFEFIDYTTENSAVQAAIQM